MGREEAGHAQEDVAGGVAGALDDALARRQRRGNVAPPPGIGQIEAVFRLELLCGRQVEKPHALVGHGDSRQE